MKIFFILTSLCLSVPYKNWNTKFKLNNDEFSKVFKLSENMESYNKLSKSNIIASTQKTKIIGTSSLLLFLLGYFGIYRGSQKISPLDPQLIKLDTFFQVNIDTIRTCKSMIY